MADADDHQPNEPAEQLHGGGRQTILAYRQCDCMDAHRDDEHDRREETEAKGQRFGVQGDKGRSGTPSPEPARDDDYDGVEQEPGGRSG
jgi:hypothetical protein